MSQMKHSQIKSKLQRMSMVENWRIFAQPLKKYERAHDGQTGIFLRCARKHREASLNVGLTVIPGSGSNPQLNRNVWRQALSHGSTWQRDGHCIDARPSSGHLDASIFAFASSRALELPRVPGRVCTVTARVVTCAFVLFGARRSAGTTRLPRWHSRVHRVHHDEPTAAGRRRDHIGNPTSTKVILATGSR